MCDEEGFNKCDLMMVMIIIILFNNIDDVFDVDKKWCCIMFNLIFDDN